MPEIVEQQPQDDGGEGEKKKESKAVVGIIYPPPEVRNIVDKTADFVARNGPEFEGRIRLNEANNTKFNFLNFGDPYHAYYQHKIKEIKEGVSQEASMETSKAAPRPTVQPVTIVTEPEIPKEPPPEWEFMAEPPAISRRHLDIVKLTAQFVARNGAHFMDQLMMREQKNETFDFLRRNHILFSYFTKLVEQYSKVLMPSYSQTEKLRQLAEHPLGVSELMDQVNTRVVWQQYQDREKRKAEEQAEKERVEYAQIDWHDFIIVETINFRESEAGYLPPPIQPSQLAARLLQQQKYDRQEEENNEVEEIEMEVEEQAMEEEAPSIESQSTVATPSLPPSVPALPSGTSNVKIRKDYNPKASAATTSQQLLVSPITGEKVPADKLEEHMRHALLDPRWVDVRKKKIEDRQQEEEVFAEGLNIASNIRHLAKKRTDIFGMEETVIGQEIGEEPQSRQPASLQWDGYTASVEKTKQLAQLAVAKGGPITQSDPDMEKIGPRVPGSNPIPSPVPPPKQIIREIPKPPPVIDQLPKPLLPTPPPMQGFIPAPAMIPHPMPHPFIHPAPPVEPPAAKKPKSDIDNLIPENQFIASHPGPVTFTVLVPNVGERSEWPLNGQNLSISLPITDPVSVIKSKIADELGMPPGKQKLQIGTLFIKDSNTLGFYNVTSETVVLLGLKERGGRKK
ncbi:PREDICTED: splicing factor 3A subunit 1-like [Amphimedon queenslandica]|uniref:Splicing factor 3A subunit 1 n=1 Tax=Amphimedon queenslandica TaxID=400682 RepID=A0A1X7UL08_AMPQE|nr:PREDICTED: splicing factor 3A subunit 1-like [Amphimedon queenslandica]|eukprot:XP_019853715.1 PREDICTED: splicing factor 3A subunit 1-like [Amphimedon queenslandica]